MSSLPAFHTQATQDAGARLQAAVSEREKADAFLALIDEILATPSAD